MRSEFMKRQSGITLVALVVTIVVLLILAGITIMYTIGDNSIFKKAQEAKEKTDQAIKNEQNYLENLANRLEEEYGTNQTTPIGPMDVPIESIKSDWATIEKIAKEIAKDDTITNNAEKVTVVVDNKKYTINAGDIFEVEYNGEVRRVRVLGFKHDDLVNKTVYGGTHEKASISFEFLDFMTGDTYKQMNTTNTNENGWAATAMRTFLNGTEGKDKLNNKTYIKQVKKQYIKTYNDTSSVTTCNDCLWLLASSEMVNDGYQEGAYGVTVTSEGNQYKYYQGVTEPYNTSSIGRIKYNGSGEAMWWWLRSPIYSNSSNFCGVYSYGIGDGSNATYNGGVAPGFSV